MLTLILGGARSGKSKLAQRLAISAGRVTYVATATGSQDSEMTARIELHRAGRPSSWQTIEEPLALASAVERASKDSDAVLVDCLTVWLSNLSWEYRDRDSLPHRLESVAHSDIERIAVAARQSYVILVSNELGSGTVPEPAVTRAFRDVHGIMNQCAAEAADEVILTVAGLPLHLKTASRQEEAR
jgi:adenosylcobinamide kinase/adenosylcobinamide-phosphate guanylyltransferase